MGIPAEIFSLLSKEFLLEWRQRQTLNGILLYLVSTIFTAYMCLGLRASMLGVHTWNALFWIILIFSAMSVAGKSFSTERENRMQYYYQIASPQAIILSKILYNTLLMLFLSLTGFLIYSLVLGNPVQDHVMFLLDLVLGATGLSGTLTLISAIASRASSGNTLTAILGFPLLIPLLLVVIRISKNAIDGLDPSVSYDKILLLIALNAMTIALSWILFPFLWRS